MDINKLMQQANKMKAEMDKKEKEFESKIFEFEKQGIKLVVNGALEIQTLDINKFLIDPEDKETLPDLVMLTFNQPIEEILKKKKEINDSFTKGMF
ncbi:MAG: YbaB/EbfC family nucleoid-associated protein [Mycoplasmataceae bacterium]|nr:YbaB/EbfC family nucleoid-associated protein [Mycoplasmataceae bacterium]